MPKQNPLDLPPGVREQVTIQAKNGTTDANGEQQYSTLFTCLGVVATQSSREVYYANQATGQATHVISIRYPVGVKVEAGMRVQFRDEYFTITTPPEDVQYRGKVMKLTCLQVGAGDPTQ